MSLNLKLPENVILKPKITVIGVGGAGGNAVNNMIKSNLQGAEFVAANTDAQALEHSLANVKIQLGENITRGLGAGASPDIGRAAAEESMADLMDTIQGSNMLFITAGMGGGTGTGAAPIVAQMAREHGILTVGVVTKPFHFEGAHRMKIAEEGLAQLQQHVDTMIVIPNQNLFRIATEKTTFADAFCMADEVLHAGVRGITDLITMPGLINLDFADIVTVMSKMGKAMMGTGEADGEQRSIKAAEAAISNPLLDHASMKGARGVLINITGGLDMTLFEVDEAANRIREEVDSDANIIFGSTFNEAVEGKIRVSVVATGIDVHADDMPRHASSRTTPDLVASALRERKATAQLTPQAQPSSVKRAEEAAPRYPATQNQQPVFMAPKAAKPAEEPHMKQQFQPEPREKRVEEESEFRFPTMSADEPKEEPAEKSSFGLFSRMNPRTQDNKPADDTQAEGQSQGEETLDDGLEIPAFLRRKQPDPQE